MPPRRHRIVPSDSDESGNAEPRTVATSAAEGPLAGDGLLSSEEEDEDEVAEEDIEEGEEEEEEEEVEEDDDMNNEAGSDSSHGSGAPRRGFSIVIRGRGRGRGRPPGPGSSLRGRGLSRGRPRGRPRGSGRGRGLGRGMPSGVSVVQHSGATDQGVSGSNAVNFPLGTAYRQISGKYYIFQDDELNTEEDDKGNKKVDPNGNLLGGRVYKAETFASPWRANPDKLYMLSIDAARTSGFRDSLYYFRRNPQVVKLTLSQSEKDHLIALGRLSTNLKSRSVTIVTARSAFKLHGAKMVKDGRWVTDDYFEEQAKAECIEKGNMPGELVGELPDLNLYPVGDINQPLRTLEERRQAAAAAGAGAGQAAATSAHGAGGLNLNAGGIYRAGGPSTHFGGAGLGPFDDALAHALGAAAVARRTALARDGVGEDNWMWKTALRAHEANEEFRLMREGRLSKASLGNPVDGGIEDTLKAARDPDEEGEEAEARRVRAIADSSALGVYEPHTDMFHYRSDTQPTKASMEQVADAGPLITGEKRVGGGAWGVMFVETRLELPPTFDTT